MILGRLGLVGFFGILIPGIYLAATLLAVLAAWLVMAGIVSPNAVLGFYEKTTLAVSSAFLLFSYSLGVSMRVIGPKRVEKMSTRFLKRIGEREREIFPWMTDVFPYERSMKSAFREAGMAGVSAFLENLNPNYSEEDNTPFFNYCKLILEGNCPEVGKLVAQAEAMSRFLSGSALAFLVSVYVWLLSACLWLLFAIFATGVSFWYAMVSGFLALMSAVLLAPILYGFKFQRRREVQLVWTGVYLLLRGGLANARQVPPAELRAAVDPNADAHVIISE